MPLIKNNTFRFLIILTKDFFYSYFKLGKKFTTKKNPTNVFRKKKIPTTV